MKVYIRAAVSIENLKNQFKDFLDKKYYDDDALDLLLSVDPTYTSNSGYGGKYAVWLLNQAKKGNYTRSDMNNIRDALKLFIRKSNKFKYQDLGRYKTVEEFIRDSHAVGNMPLTEKEKKKQLKKEAHNADVEDKKLLATDGNWELWTPLTYPGSISLAREGGTKAEWCTAYEGDDYYYQDYTSKGPLYVFINKNNPKEKYQTHFETESWFFNIHDDDLGRGALIKFLSKHRNFLDPLGITITPFKEIIQSGKLYGTNKIEITSTGASFVIRGEVLHDYANDTYIKVPDSITKLVPYAFEGCDNVTDIDLNNVKSIDSYAFEGCKSLKTLDLSNVEGLSRTALIGNNITELTVSNSIIDFCNSYKFPDSLKTFIVPENMSISLYFLGAMPYQIKNLYVYSRDISIRFSLKYKSDRHYTLHLTNSESTRAFAETVSEYCQNVKIVYDL